MQGRLTMELREYWHASSGEAGGEDLDVVVVRDRAGLPYLPGRTVRGLLREAVQLAERWGAVGEGSAVRLFGKPPDAGDSASSRDGCLRFEDAVLPEGFRSWARAAGEPARREVGGLFEVLSQTALDGESGTARAGSLRRVEVVIPVTLTSAVSALHAGAPECWMAILERCAPLVRGLGRGRQRGLGRCRCRFDVEGNGA